MSRGAQLQRGPERAVDLLVETIRRSIDAGKPVGLVPIQDEPGVSALVVMNTGATFERRWLGSEWVWVETPPVPSSPIAVLRVLEEHPVAGEITRREMYARSEFNQRAYSALRHVWQSLLREQSARETLAAAREEVGNFTRPMGVPSPTEAAEKAFDHTATIADAAIGAFTDQLYDLFELARASAGAPAAI